MTRTAASHSSADDWQDAQQGPQLQPNPAPHRRARHHPLLTATLANAAAPLLAIIVSPVLSRELGPTGRGEYASLTTFCTVFGVLGTLGLQDAFARFVAHGQLTPRSATKLSLLSILPIGAACCLFALLAAQVLYARSEATRAHLLWLLPLLPLQILVNLSLGIASGANDQRSVNRIRIATASMRAAQVLFGCYLFQLDPIAASFILLYSPVFALMWNYTHLRRTPPSGVVHYRSTVPPLFSFGLSAFPGIVAGLSAARLDQLIGLPLIGSEDLGIYAVAVSLAELPTMISVAGRTMLLGTDPGPCGRASRTRLAYLTLLMTALASTALASTVPFGLTLVFGKAFAPAVAPSMILIAATPIYALGILLSTYLIAEGKPGTQSIALTTGALTNLVSFVVLSPMGAIGAALASLIGYLATALVAVAFLRQQLTQSQGSRR